MIIKYKVEKWMIQEKQIEIKDPMNVFLKGENYLEKSYFGIWNDKNRIFIISILNGDTIKYYSYSNMDFDVSEYLSQYLRNCEKVEIITKNEFKQQIQNIIKIIDINVNI